MPKLKEKIAEAYKNNKKQVERYVNKALRRINARIKTLERTGKKKNELKRLREDKKHFETVGTIFDCLFSALDAVEVKAEFNFDTSFNLKWQQNKDCKDEDDYSGTSGNGKSSIEVGVEAGNLKEKMKKCPGIPAIANALGNPTIGLSLALEADWEFKGETKNVKLDGKYGNLAHEATVTWVLDPSKMPLRNKPLKWIINRIFPKIDIGFKSESPPYITKGDKYGEDIEFMSCD